MDDVLRLAVRAAGATPPAPDLLGRLGEVLVPAAADWLVADLLAPPDLVTRVVAVGRAGPLPLPSSGGPVGARRSSAAGKGVLTRLVDAPGRILRLTPADLQRMAASDERRTRAQGVIALQLGTTDLLLLGVGSSDQLLAVLAVGRTGGTFSEREVSELADVATVAGLALDRSRLLGVQRSVSTALQQSLLPRLPVVPEAVLTARFVPAGSGLAVGGDWYDAFGLPSGELALVIGDATGHDVQAATRMAQLRDLLRALAVDRGERPAPTLARLDDLLAALAPELSGTCVLAQLTDTDSGRALRWSSAGHLPPVLLRDGRAELLETAPDLMLGVRAGTVRHDHERRLHPGDVVLLYTDGLVERRRSGLDERLTALLRVVEQIGGDDPEVLADRLLDELAAGEDDVAVLVVQVPSPAGA